MTFEQQVRELAAKGAESVCELVDVVIREGLQRGASDIHLEPGDGSLNVRFRLDGVLHPAVIVPFVAPLNVIARIKVLADLLTYQTDTPQEGRIDRAKVGAPADLRVATFPTVHGEKAVIRLFDERMEVAQLGELGYPAAIRAELERQLLMPTGMILLTGPAGSGKTTTIYAALRHVLQASREARHIVSIEDPAEQIVDGVTQTQIRPGSGLTFARSLRSLLRQDPEVIAVGEIRDRETADIAVEAGLTGHLVISTIHSGTAAGVFTRLLDMQVAPHLLTSSVNFVVAQRLVRKLCARCSRSVGDVGGLAGFPADLLGAAHEAAGCEACFGTGYRGRTVIAEALRRGPALHAAITARAATEALEAEAIASGMAPLRLAAVEAIRTHVTSPAEVRRVLGPV